MKSKKEMYTTEETEKYLENKKLKVFQDRYHRKTRRMGYSFHKSTKLTSLGKRVGVTFTGVCDKDKAEKLANRDIKRRKLTSN